MGFGVSLFDSFEASESDLTWTLPRRPCCFSGCSHLLLPLLVSSLFLFLSTANYCYCYCYGDYGPDHCHDWHHLQILATHSRALIPKNPFGLVGWELNVPAMATHDVQQLRFCLHRPIDINLLCQDSGCSKKVLIRVKMESSCGWMNSSTSWVCVALGDLC